MQSKKEQKKEKKEKKEDRINKVKADKIKLNPKGKGKGRIPEAIMKLGGTSKNPAGEILCFAYNIGGCGDAADGAKCKRGLHVCAKCFGLRSIQNHE